MPAADEHLQELDIVTRDPPVRIVLARHQEAEERPEAEDQSPFDPRPAEDIGRLDPRLSPFLLHASAPRGERVRPNRDILRAFAAK